ncbi:hypothetical protein PanWU01x14_329390 [Parasponia andersonii]|uniref:CLAVATA3/ESR (CLE)-related protein n=1 Tax=Parasponia andersonii TaxID=3476 RepID=A0A2P5AIF5_PARAD|nr:hypothetical protein PanWU01x14_329390 [Parasponia andersonii]
MAKWKFISSGMNTVLGLCLIVLRVLQSNSISTTSRNWVRSKPVDNARSLRLRIYNHHNNSHLLSLDRYDRVSYSTKDDKDIKETSEPFCFRNC